MIVRYFLFSLKKGDEFIGAVIIAGETPLYVGRLLVGTEAIEDLSELVVPGEMTARLGQDLIRIAANAGDVLPVLSSVSV